MTVAQIIPMIASAVICALGIYLSDKRLVIAAIVLSPPVSTLVFGQSTRMDVAQQLALYLVIVLVTGFIFGLLTFRRTAVLQTYVGRESLQTIILSVTVVGLLIGSVLSLSDNITYVISAALALSLLSPLVVLGTTLAQKFRDPSLDLSRKMKRLSLIFVANLVSVMAGYYATKFILSLSKQG